MRIGTTDRGISRREEGPALDGFHSAFWENPDTGYESLSIRHRGPDTEREGPDLLYKRVVELNRGAQKPDGEPRCGDTLNIGHGTGVLWHYMQEKPDIRLEAQVPIV